MDKIATTENKVIVKRKRDPFLIEVFKRLVKEKPLATIGFGIIVAFLLVALLADVISPYSYIDGIMADRLSPPSSTHLLGTDNLGRDLLSRIIYGARVSMIVGLSVAAISTTLCTIIGGLSGFFGGTVDLVIQRCVDAIMCFPPLIIMLAVVAVIGPGLWQVIIVLGVMGGIGGRTRVVRSTVLAIRQNAYIESAKATGARDYRIYFDHVLPNIMAAVIVLFTIETGAAIIGEASLSFLGYGIPPPFPSWGGMLSDSGRRYMLSAPWMALWPGLVLSIVVYGINMLGDGLRDILDPRLRGGLGRYSGTKIHKQRQQAVKSTTLSGK